MANFGGGVAGAIFGGLWTSLLLNYLTGTLPSALKSQAADLMGDVTQATSYAWGTPERDDIASAYRGSYRAQALGSLVFAILALLVSLPIRNVVCTESEGREMEAGTAVRRDTESSVVVKEN